MRDPLQRHIESGALDRWITGNWDGPPYLSDGDECDGSGWVLVERSGFYDPKGDVRMMSLDMSVPCPGCPNCQESEPDPDRKHDAMRERRAEEE